MSTPNLDRFTQGNRPGGTHYTEGWVVPRTGLDGCRKSRPQLEFDPRTVASRYTDCAVPVRFYYFSVFFTFISSSHFLLLQFYTLFSPLIYIFFLIFFLLGFFFFCLFVLLAVRPAAYAVDSPQAVLRAQLYL